MAINRKDVTATVLTTLAVLAFFATHQGWNVWLIGGSHRWAAGAIFVLGAFTGDEEQALPEAIERAVAGIRTFCLQGTDAAIALVNSNNGDAVP